MIRKSLKFFRIFGAISLFYCFLSMFGLAQTTTHYSHLNIGDTCLTVLRNDREVYIVHREFNPITQYTSEDSFRRGKLLSHQYLLSLPRDTAVLDERVLFVSFGHGKAHMYHKTEPYGRLLADRTRRFTLLDRPFTLKVLGFPKQRLKTHIPLIPYANDPDYHGDKTDKRDTGLVLVSCVFVDSMLSYSQTHPLYKMTFTIPRCYLRKYVSRYSLAIQDKKMAQYFAQIALNDEKDREKIRHEATLRAYREKEALLQNAEALRLRDAYKQIKNQKSKGVNGSVDGISIGDIFHTPDMEVPWYNVVVRDTIGSENLYLFYPDNYFLHKGALTVIGISNQDCLVRGEVRSGFGLKTKDFMFSIKDLRLLNDEFNKAEIKDSSLMFKSILVGDLDISK